MALVIGSLLPDFDKILNIFGVSSGRGYCHTIIVLIILSIVLVIISKENKKIYTPFIIGWISHLILDYNETLPLFYPFIEYNMSPYNILGFVETLNYFVNLFITQPIVIASEVLGGLFLIFLISFNYYKKHNKKRNKEEIFLQISLKEEVIH